MDIEHGVLDKDSHLQFEIARVGLNNRKVNTHERRDATRTKRMPTKEKKELQAVQSAQYCLPRVILTIHYKTILNYHHCKDIAS
jgi:hypothetical protein